jgi:hypothetical protein
VAALVLVTYLTVTTCGPPAAHDRPSETCADRVVYHASRLSDC